MKAISFRLSGKSACFRKPDVNQFAYFTYNNIHKPALLGIFGAILGLGGHTQLHNENRKIKEENKSIKKKTDKKVLNEGYPEFYEKLQHLKVSIVPLSAHGYFSKKIQVFNNSVGYASKEMGGNLIVREQWLEDPDWQILILDDNSDEYKALKKYLIDGKCTFIPYLGKNDHPAKIEEIEEISLDKRVENSKIYSLFIENECDISNMKPRGELSSYFKEISPFSLQEKYHFYEYKDLIFTNHQILSSSNHDIYAHEDKNYFFF